MGYKSDLKLGDIICSTSCGEFEVIKRDVPNKATVRFIKTGYEVESNTFDVSSGNIKDPYFPQVLGIGYFGEGNYVARNGLSELGFNKTPEYNAWINMLQRCYYYKYVCREQGSKAYDGATVDPDWHNFQNFAAWYLEKRKPLDEVGLIRPNLDKEILSPTKKAILYSSDTCCVVPSEINAMLIGQNKIKENGLPLCINTHKAGYKVSMNANRKMTYFISESLDECINWRNGIYQQKYTALAKKYRNVLESRVYEKLCNWDKF